VNILPACQPLMQMFDLLGFPPSPYNKINIHVGKRLLQQAVSHLPVCPDPSPHAAAFCFLLSHSPNSLYRWYLQRQRGDAEPICCKLQEVVAKLPGMFIRLCRQM
jgi:hypothetical protein